jgi:hypothetical protein
MSLEKKTPLYDVEVDKRIQREFLKLVERFRNAADAKEAQRLGDKLGRMVFGG